MKLTRNKNIAFKTVLEWIAPYSSIIAFNFKIDFCIRFIIQNKIKL